MKIILCSTRDSVRDRWRSILQKHAYSVYQASALEAIQTIVHKGQQYLLLIDQPFMDLQTIGTFSRKKDTFKIFVLSDTPGKEDGIKLMMIGAVGYANTYISEGRLVEAVKIIESGRVWFNQEVLAQFIQTVHPKKINAATEGSSEVLSLLTERERDIAVLVARGLSNKEIGDQLYVSERTVKSHLSSIFAKTGAESRLKLALLING